VQAANADPPNFWRLRETQTLVGWLKDRPRSAILASEIHDWLQDQPGGPWWSTLREGINDFASELGDRETDRNDVIEWLAEWGREVRKRQTGLLLLSAHRAKGLEFDDVVVLDGGWERISQGEDKDAARRLYYVAMTRARRSLALLSLGKEHPILRGIDDPAFLIRSCSENPVDVSDCRKLYQTLDLSQVDMGYAGRLPDGHASLSAIDQLSTGDPIRLKQVGERWMIKDTGGVVVGRLAKKFQPPANAEFVEGSVFAISTRLLSATPEEYQLQLKQERWLIVLPELVFCR
jgi:ATP-dependent DNA helicase RecQ